MTFGTRSLRKLDRVGLSFATAVCLTGAAGAAHAADYMPLPVVKPVTPCEALANLKIARVDGSAVTIETAKVLNTPKGAYCQVTGNIEPTASFEVTMPMERWTQRLYQSASTGGNIAVRSKAEPAANGEFAVAINDRNGRAGRGGWTLDPEKRISWAYKANHQTTVVAKTLINAFYQQQPRFSYFAGCSGGGRESMIAAQRYPDDFDGISAGAAAMFLNISNGGFFHSWEYKANRRTDGTFILTKDRLPILHTAVMENCGKVSGVLDGVLLAPNACTFNPTWVLCKTADTAKCLTAEEVAVAQKLYDSSSDDSGRRFEMKGFPLGSELFWPLSTAAGPADGQTDPGRSLQYLLPLPEANQDMAKLGASFRFNQEWFEKLGILAPLYNGANTNLEPLRKSGGKLLMWHGGSDLQVQPDLAIAYHEGVQKQLGAQGADEVMRLFVLPGVGHCSGGDGADQVDTIAALMKWVELKQAPEYLVTGKLAARPARGGGGAEREDFGPPYVEPANPALAYTRPVYPYGNIAKYNGSGDPTAYTSYSPVKADVKSVSEFKTEAHSLVGPNNQKQYHVVNGTPVPLRQ